MSPACRRMLFSVPGARSSFGCPATVTRPGFVGCLYCRWLPFWATMIQPSSSIIRRTSRTVTTMCSVGYSKIFWLIADERSDSPSRRDGASTRSRLIVGFGAILGSSIRPLICQVDRPRPNRFLYFCVILPQSFRIVSDFFGDLVPNPSYFFEYWRSCHDITFPQAIP